MSNRKFIPEKTLENEWMYFHNILLSSTDKTGNILAPKPNFLHTKSPALIVGYRNKTKQKSIRKHDKRGNKFRHNHEKKNLNNFTSLVNCWRSFVVVNHYTHMIALPLQ